MSPPPPRPPSPASDDRTAASTELLPPRPSAAHTPSAGDDGTGTLVQPPPPPAPDHTECQAPRDRPGAADPNRTVAQQLSDRIQSESISRRLDAAGYTLIRQLGEGTYGVVWLAEERSTGVKVAIKFFAHGAGRRWEMLQEEVRRLAELDAAQGIVHLKDAVADADPPYYVMSYAEGGSLAQRLEKGPLPVPEALTIFKDIAKALAYVHAHGIRHCDLKPGNVLLDRLGQSMVADFGQAHLSNDATPALGTFFYMAPEQADLGDQIPDTRWDVYGLGALFYAMLTGQPPRKDAGLSGELKDTVELSSRLRRYREGIARTPKPTDHYHVSGVDRRLARIIDACLEIDPQKRLPSAEAVLNALKRRRARMRQQPLIVAGVVAPLLIILGMMAVGAMAADGQTRQAKEALVDQIMDSDQAAARLGAWGMQRSFGRRFKAVENLLDGGDGAALAAQAAQDRRDAEAGDPAKARALAADRERLHAWLKTTAVQQRLGETLYISGLSVVDPDGYMLMSVDRDHGWDPAPTFAETAKRNWSWRDWFNGQGDQPEGTPYPPVTAHHISQPYKSTDGTEKVDLTVPVRVPGDDAPAAVLVGSMKWAETSKWLTQLKLKGGRVVVFNDHDQFLMHGDDAVLAGLKDYHDQPPQYEGLAATLAAARDGRRAYRDPLDGREYYVGCQLFDPYKEAREGDDEPDASGGWGVIVQHEKGGVLGPVVELNRRMQWYGAAGLVGAGVVTGGLWWGLIWLLRRQERLGHG